MAGISSARPDDVKGNSMPFSAAAVIKAAISQIVAIDDNGQPERIEEYRKNTCECLSVPDVKYASQTELKGPWLRISNGCWLMHPLEKDKEKRRKGYADLIDGTIEAIGQYGESDDKSALSRLNAINERLKQK
jgi:hypothetical protein